jgi:ADP-ribosylglycohydrolase
MIGAIIGDIVGSPYEGSSLNWVDDRNFPLFAKQWSRFTDDTILTCATADALLHPVRGEGENFPLRFRDWALKYPGRGYGSGFQEWVDNGGTTVNKSYANGCMMRCSPIGLFCQDYAIAMIRAKQSIENTHNSPEAERGAKSIVSAIHMALNGYTKLQIQGFVEENFGHMLDMSVEDWRNHPKPNIRCNLTAPQALVCFMESTDYESAVRNAVYTKGDTDTIAAIAGSIAEAFYGVRSIPQEMIDGAKERMTPEMIELTNEFYAKIGEYHEQYRDFII